MRYYEKAESEIKLEAKIENVLTEIARLLLIREVNEKNTREEFNTRIIRRYKRHELTLKALADRRAQTARRVRHRRVA